MCLLSIFFLYMFMLMLTINKIALYKSYVYTIIIIIKASLAMQFLNFEFAINPS